MYKAFLVLHVIGITIMAGATFIDYMIYRQFWRAHLSDSLEGLMLERIGNRLQRFLGIGMLLIIISGIGMMFYMHHVWGQQVWFRIKMVVLLVIIFNGLALRRSIGSKIQQMVQSSSTEGVQMSKLKTSMTFVQSIQMILFVIIFILSVFKFN
jgi:hypothetical protein